MNRMVSSSPFTFFQSILSLPIHTRPHTEKPPEMCAGDEASSHKSAKPKGNRTRGTRARKTLPTPASTKDQVQDQKRGKKRKEAENQEQSETNETKEAEKAIDAPDEETTGAPRSKKMKQGADLQPERENSDEAKVPDEDKLIHPPSHEKPRLSETKGKMNGGEETIGKGESTPKSPAPKREENGDAKRTPESAKTTNPGDGVATGAPSPVAPDASAATAAVSSSASSSASTSLSSSASPSSLATTTTTPLPPNSHVFPHSSLHSSVSSTSTNSLPPSSAPTPSTAQAAVNPAGGTPAALPSAVESSPMPSGPSYTPLNNFSSSTSGSVASLPIPQIQQAYSGLSQGYLYLKLCSQTYLTSHLLQHKIKSNPLKDCSTTNAIILRVFEHRGNIRPLRWSTSFWLRSSASQANLRSELTPMHRRTFGAYGKSRPLSIQLLWWPAEILCIWYIALPPFCIPLFFSQCCGLSSYQAPRWVPTAPLDEHRRRSWAEGVAMLWAHPTPSSGRLVGRPPQLHPQHQGSRCTSEPPDRRLSLQWRDSPLRSADGPEGTTRAS